jgi:hypothetical protein
MNEAIDEIERKMAATWAERDATLTLRASLRRTIVEAERIVAERWQALQIVLGREKPPRRTLERTLG